MSEKKTKEQRISEQVEREVSQATREAIVSASPEKQESTSSNRLSIKESFSVFLADYKAANSK